MKLNLFPLFPRFENTAWEWSQHLEAHKYIQEKEWEEQRGREGPENEGWGWGFTLQLNQANSSLLPKKGGPISTFLSFPTFHCWQNKSRPSCAATLMLAWTWWAGSALCPRRKLFIFLYFGGSQLSESWTSWIHLAPEWAQGKAYSHRAKSNAWPPLLEGASG